MKAVPYAFLHCAFFDRLRDQLFNLRRGPNKVLLTKLWEAPRSQIYNGPTEKSGFALGCFGVSLQGWAKIYCVDSVVKRLSWMILSTRLRYTLTWKMLTFFVFEVLVKNGLIVISSLKFGLRGCQLLRPVMTSIPARALPTGNGSCGNCRPMPSTSGVGICWNEAAVG